MTSNSWGAIENRSAKSTGSTLPCPRSKVNHWDAAQVDLAGRLTEGLPPYMSIILKGSNPDFPNAVDSKSVCLQLLPSMSCCWSFNTWAQLC